MKGVRMLDNENSKVQAQVFVYERDSFLEREEGKSGVCASFMARDIFNLSFKFEGKEISKIKEIYSVEVDKSIRRQGYGLQKIKDIISEEPEEVYVASIAALMSEYPEEPTPEEFERIMNDLTMFFASAGFISVNDYVGCYEGRDALLYVGNRIGKALNYFLVMSPANS